MIELSEEVQRDLRARALKTWNWSLIAEETGIPRTTVVNVLEAAWHWEHTKCSQCWEAMSYRVHVDFPRRYGRCHRCAARQWEAELKRRAA